MKIGMQTWGSHGDIRPFLALAEGLALRGHDVRLVITCVDSDAYAGVVSPAGVRIEVLASPVLAPDQAAQLTSIGYTLRNPMTQMETLLRVAYAPVEDRMFEAARALCAESDLVIGHYFLHPLQIAAEEAGKPHVSVLLSHAAIPSESSNPFGVTARSKTVNRLLWRLTRVALNRMMLHYPNRLRQDRGLAPNRDLVDEVWISPGLALLGVSPALCDPQPDWPASVRACGFLDMPNMALEGTLPPQLADFMAAGPAPVYMTFGSWMPKDIPAQTATLRLLSEAARLAGCRAIIQSPAAQACGFASNDQVLYIGYAPHHAIFPQCRAILHHGGAGTTQAACLAGKPSVIVAHLSEQEHWGGELRRLGVAGKPTRRRSVTPRQLARRIRELERLPDVQAKAAALAQAMRAENGVATAIAAIEARFAAQSGPAAAPPRPAGRDVLERV